MSSTEDYVKTMIECFEASIKCSKERRAKEIQSIIDARQKIDDLTKFLTFIKKQKETSSKLLTRDEILEKIILEK